MKKCALILLLLPIFLLSLQVKSHASVLSKEGEFISFSKQYIGVPYRYGGSTPSGFDCSGYINYVYNQYGYTLPRTSADMYASKSLSPVKDLKVGDIMFFSTYKPGASHAGIYVGNNEFIHASSSKGVTVSKLEESYWNKRYLGAKRHNELSSDLSFSTDAEAKKLWQKASNYYLNSSVTNQNQELVGLYNLLRGQVKLDSNTVAGEHLLRTANLIDSTKLANTLSGTTNQLADKMIANQELTDETVTLYQEQSADIRKSERVYSRLYGPDMRNRFNKESVTPAKIAKETVIYEVSMYLLLDTINNTKNQGNLEEARNLLEKYDRLERRAIEIKVLGNSLHANAYQNLDRIHRQLQEEKGRLQAELQTGR
ncbi:NlpC/P60 family protein [Metabacillus halosaccharovorans]|uniref:NlpC/P60 family protein n=1 Tax=Metabacillus halosaccharovorans TaxID=930124 RepID=UPI000995B1CF|nr:NlpC/P60 family protein [Metabacillus halosaccharovorans]